MIFGAVAGNDWGSGLFRGEYRPQKEERYTPDDFWINICGKMCASEYSGNDRQSKLLRKEHAASGFAFMMYDIIRSNSGFITQSPEYAFNPAKIESQTFSRKLEEDFKDLGKILGGGSQGSIVAPKREDAEKLKEFPFLEHCCLKSSVQKAEAMLSWLQTSNTEEIFGNVACQRMFCKFLTNNPNGAESLTQALKDPELRAKFVKNANAFFKASLEALPEKIESAEDINKYKLYASIYFQLNKAITDAGGEEQLDSSVFNKEICSLDKEAPTLDVQLVACVLCKKAILNEDLTNDEILMCLDPKMMIWPEMAGADKSLLRRNSSDTFGVKNMFESETMEKLREFIRESSSLTEARYQEIAKAYATKLGVDDNISTKFDDESKSVQLLADGQVMAIIDFENFLILDSNGHRLNL
jgi:hypothetical protein